MTNSELVAIQNYKLICDELSVKIIEAGEVHQKNKELIQSLMLENIKLQAQLQNLEDENETLRHDLIAYAEHNEQLNYETKRLHQINIKKNSLLVRFLKFFRS